MKGYKSEFIPIKPMSINTCYQGRRFRTGVFKKWQEAVLYSLPSGYCEGKAYALTIYIYLKDPTRSDLDNYIKPLVDCCVKKGLLTDDRYVKYLEVIKKHNKEEGFEVIIRKIK